MKTACLLSTLVLAATTAWAQPAPDGSYALPQPSYQPVPLQPADFCHWEHHPSTFAEGYLRGLAAWLHAQGNFLVNVQQASIMAQYVRSMDLTNRRRRVEYHDWKQDRRESRLDAKRRKNEAARQEKFRAAYELSPKELNRTTGAIDWPEALRAARYQEARQRLGLLFEEQVGYVRSREPRPSEIERESQRLIREFELSRGAVPRPEYAAAQKFLRGLKYEPLFRSQVF